MLKSHTNNICGRNSAAMARRKGRRQEKQEGKIAGDSLRWELEDAYKQFKEAYEKAYRLPEGVEEDAVRIGKYADER